MTICNQWVVDLSPSYVVDSPASKKQPIVSWKERMGWVVTAGIVKKLGIDFFHLQQEWNLEIPDAGRLEVAVEIVFKTLNAKTVIPRRKKRSVWT